MTVATVIVCMYQSERTVPAEHVERLGELIEPWFCFSLVWTVGATCDNDSRTKFDQWMRDTMAAANVSLQTLMCCVQLFSKTFYYIYCLALPSTILVPRLGHTMMNKLSPLDSVFRIHY